MKEKLVSGLRKFFRDCKKEQAVIGLSGGVDSAVTLALTAQALGKEKVTALFMPEEGLTSEENKADVFNLARQLGVRMETIPLNSFLKTTKDFPWGQTKLAQMNLKPRIRMLILYNYANTHEALVVGTSNRSEILLGYGTKYGDGAADVLPLGELYKTEVFELAKQLNLPPSIINKKPSAELFFGQTDEEEMGISYVLADQILQDYVDKKIDKNELLQKYCFPEVETVLSRLQVHRHKRIPVPVIKKRKVALFMGRFQPFHLGHLDACQQISQQYDHIVIAVGSAQYSNEEENPFTFAQRKEIIHKTLEKEKISYEIIAINDIHNHRTWVEYVNSLVPDYDAVFTSNPVVEELFAEKNIPVNDVKFNLKISAKRLREMFIKKNEEWKRYLHPEVVEKYQEKLSQIFQLS